MPEQPHYRAERQRRRKKLVTPRPALPNRTRPKGPIDPITRTWYERILDLQHATGFNTAQMAKLLSTNRRCIDKIERDYTAGKPYRPDIETIRKIRRIEEQFAVALRQYRNEPALYDRLAIPKYRVVKRCTFDPYAGRDEYAVIRVGTKRPRKKPLRFPKEAASRPEDIARDLAPLGVLGTAGAPLAKKRVFSQEHLEKLAQARATRWYKFRCNRLLRWATSGAFVEIVESRSEREDGEALGLGFADVEREREWGIVYGVEETSGR